TGEARSVVTAALNSVHIGDDSARDLNLCNCPDGVEEMFAHVIAAGATLAERARARSDAAAENDAIVEAIAMREAMEKAQARFAQSAALPYDVAVYSQQADAEIARGMGRPDPSCWEDVADIWESTNRLPNAAYARYREAQARLQAGDGAATAA